MILSRSAAVLALLIAACGANPPEGTAEGEEAAAPAAGGLDRRAIESATFAPPPPAPQTGQPASAATPQPAVLRAQILLDRARFSPGVIDGLGGENTRQAIAAYEQANGLPSDGQLDEAVFNRLTSSDGAPVLLDYTLTDQDVAGPFIGTVPEDLEALSRLQTVGYANAAEAVAEKFHVTEAVLQALNPGVDFARAGQRIVVPAIGTAPLPGEVVRIVVDKREKAVRAYGDGDRLLAFYPATIGSEERPAPTGEVTVVGVAPEPDYTYDPRRVSYDKGDRRVRVPAGPNNPVGSVWIDLSRDTYGIHGTPDPSKIGYTASNGCVRLTNWTAEQLAAAVKPGVRVVFR
jgi:lipoprotein-anchoring transpeptidase ErfK/SrfK